MSKAAQLLRHYEFNVSTAEVIDAQRLADQLAGMRDLPLPGIEELMDAATTDFGQGRSNKLEIISQLILGIKQVLFRLRRKLCHLAASSRETPKTQLISYWVANPKEHLDLDLRKRKAS